MLDDLEKIHSTPPDYSGNVVSKFHVDWIQNLHRIISLGIKKQTKISIIGHSPNIVREKNPEKEIRNDKEYISEPRQRSFPECTSYVGLRLTKLWKHWPNIKPECQSQVFAGFQDPYIELQKPRGALPMLFYSWSSVTDCGPTLNSICPFPVNTRNCPMLS